jgi:hypothetical protein
LDGFRPSLAGSTVLLAETMRGVRDGRFGADRPVWRWGPANLGFSRAVMLWPVEGWVNSFVRV